MHAYCLMSNHFHLLVETPEANLSSAMRQLNGVYTQTFNRRHSRVGNVLEGRFKVVVVERDSYLLELSRSVVLNPVRAPHSQAGDVSLVELSSDRGAHACSALSERGVAACPVWATASCY